jgi:hypothetical protein
VKTTDVPHLKGEAVTEAKKPPEQKAEPKAETKAAAKDLSPASESSDPAVHAVLAELDAAIQNGDPEAEGAARKRLAALGCK